MIELLVVIAIIAILASLLLPALVAAKEDALVTNCMNEKKQLLTAWVMYGNENNDTLAANFDYHDDGQYEPGTTTPSWIEGWLDWSTGADNTNVLNLTSPQFSLLGPYIANATKIFWCPADIFVGPLQRPLGWPNRCRSVTMNGAIGTGVKYMGFPWSEQYFVNVQKMSQIYSPGIADTWVFMDEQPDSIDDGLLYVDVSTIAMTRGIGQFTEFPASYHNQSCGISFADGHAECHKWLGGSQTRIPVTYVAHEDGVNQQVNINSPDPDLIWLAMHTPYSQ